MSADIASINLKVLIMDSDFYALQAINSYLAWDRRTRVTFLAQSVEQMQDYLAHTPYAELPDVIVMDADHVGGATALRQLINDLRQRMPDVRVVCLGQHLNLDLVQAAADAGAVAFMLKQEVRLQIAWAICYTLDHDFVVTSSIARKLRGTHHRRLSKASVLPEQREYPELTDRIRQAIKLCVVEGMPAHLAADEMGISLHTIRGYIKEGYRILEAHDDTEYPVDMTPQERAFMRFTALANEDD
ncbi:MAG: DNA-binding response regulator [Chloroflexi bacterium]|nr:MAG: DNA-binding response regulator [Chloroflexota bacterium]